MSVEHINNRVGILRKILYSLSHSKLGEILVVQGSITPSQLRQSLKLQRQTQKPLGQILIDLGLVNKSQLSALLFKQRLLRIAATGVLFISSCGSFIKPSRASNVHSKPLPANILLASASAADFGDIQSYPALFGADETRSTNLNAFTKWLEVFERLEQELQSTKAKRIIHAMKIELSEYHSASIFEMAQNVDRMMNRKKYIVDSENWGKSDYWATPVEFMTRGGDCEDFAIAKYTALRALGVPEDRLRLAIVQDLEKNIPHAVLIAYTEKGPYVLDNQSEIMRSSDDVDHYQPIYSINREAWWLHTTPDDASPTIVASAK
ncbi:MAG: transglutaminase-like cysteine peptidase [Alphaproteobacteria bacterium]